MIETKSLRKLKELAKRYARSNRIAQHQALDMIAGELGFPHWNKLVAALKKGWQASPEHMANVEVFVTQGVPSVSIRQGDPEALARRLAYLGAAENGMIGGHAYRLQEIFHDVLMVGEGWSLRVPENPGAIPIVETYTPPGQSCPVHDAEFLDAALRLARDRALQVRGEISTDWPRRSTKPDQQGVVRHPLSLDESNEWFCVRCQGKMSGAEIAKNLWHCPGCGASPLDIFHPAHLSNDELKGFRPVKTNGGGQGAPDVRIVDSRPKLELTEEKVALLIRSALLEDVTNVSERLGALTAEITVDDDCVWIALEADLWPEDKIPDQAVAEAALLGFEVELETMWADIPFAWPGLGEVTPSTTEYTRMMLDAYAQRGELPDRMASRPEPELDS